jgi:uncharacterized sporulation protein YeaH/YhbH (DUF444 family)
MVGQQQEERLMSELIYIDRRKAGRGKSLPNRQLFIRRIREFIKKSRPQNIGTGSVGKTSSQQSNPVKVAAEALEEPRFVYHPNTGDNVWIINGNPKFMRGDEIDLDQQGSGGQGTGKGAGSGGSGEDDFVINIAADEFFDLFFEDCELPNLTNEKETDKLENDRSHAGFTPNGIPAQLSVVRTFKQALGRRRALAGPYRDELAQLNEEHKDLLINLAGTTDEQYAKGIDARLAEIEERIVVLQRKIAAIAAFDKVDLRYRKSEHKPLHTVDAVLIMIMDISGSMGEHEKTVARRWFATLYAFMKRRYTTCDLIFIAHTSDAYEMSENDFFSTRINGGTMVSPALAMANKIVKERYDHTQTNIYVSNASDGDNWPSDEPAVIDEMDKLISKIQHFSYIETPNPWMAQYYEQYGGVAHDTSLWETYEKVDVPQSKMSMSVIKQPEDVYGVFKQIFKKRPK